MNDNENDNIQADDVTANAAAPADQKADQNAAATADTQAAAPVAAGDPTTPVRMNEAPTTPLAGHPMDPSSWAAPTVAPGQPYAGQPYAGQPYAGQPYEAPVMTEPVAPKKSRTPVVAIAIATAAVLCIGGLGTAGVAILTKPSTSATSSSGSSGSTTFPNRNGFGQFGPNSGQGTTPGNGSSGTSTNSTPTASTDAEKKGVVTINTVLDYDNSSQAAGTGMIISSDGLILTNNHVIEQSTSIKVTVESTNKTYTATVVGTDATNDVAVLKLVGASGLDTVTLDANEKVAVGDTIKSVGNAEGTGDLVTAKGTVAAVDQKLTISSDFSSEGESLSGLIELNSDVVSGDSGGPLFDSDGEVIGIVTAASTGAASVTGYAINIASAIAIADQIEAGEASDTIVIGYPAFLGIGIANSSTGVAGVPVGSIFSGTPAEKAGITAGSTITKVGNTTITSSTQLSKIIAGHKVGDQITVTWKSATGVTHTATVTLAAGPAA